MTAKSNTIKGKILSPEFEKELNKRMKFVDEIKPDLAKQIIKKSDTNIDEFSKLLITLNTTLGTFYVGVLTFKVSTSTDLIIFFPIIIMIVSLLSFIFSLIPRKSNIQTNLSNIIEIYEKITKRKINLSYLGTVFFILFLLSSAYVILAV